MTFNEERDTWVNDLFNKYYIDSWKKNYIQKPTSQEELNKIHSLELFIRGKCNLACKYCYITRHGSYLYPEEIDDFNIALKNTQKIIDWLIKEKLLPKTIEIFGGEAISWKQYKNFFDILNIYFDFLTEEQRKRINITMPINVIFLKIPEYFSFFKDLQKKLYEKKIVLSYSISMDGKFIDPHSRPAVNPNFLYDDDFYSTISRFCRECSLKPSFHPMISKENIQDWEKNFLWYISFIKNTYNLQNDVDAFNFLYLLEVRNADWSIEEIKHLENFYFFVSKYVSKRVKRNLNSAKKETMNIFSTFGLTSRGLTCSLQTTLMLRVGDMSIAPCHRLFYKNYISAYINTEKNRVFESANPYAHFSALAVNFRNIAPCSTCEFSTLCSGPCLGSNYEVTKDMFIVPENVCLLEKSKIYGILKGIESENRLNEFIHLIDEQTYQDRDYSVYMKNKSKQLKYVRDIILREKKDE